VCAPKLAELNPYVSVNLLEDEVLETSLLKNYTVVVLIDMELEKLLLFSDYCHKNGIYLIVADVFGVFGSVFCDFGDAFTVLDSTGEVCSLNSLLAL
jgi:ubiquitin-activating enzyme E1